MASHMEENIPQWKKDLIQRRKCQSKTICSQLSNTRLSSSSDLSKNDLDVQNTSPRAGSSSGDIRRGSGGSVDSLPSITGYKPQCSLNGAAADTLSTDLAPLDHVNEASDSLGSSEALKQSVCVTKCANNLNNMVEDRHTMASPHNGDGDSDSSEELQYGPGIVNKLKCKYLSLALRESSSKTRPSILSLRRATSLDNILDDSDGATNAMPEVQPRKYQARTPDAPGVQGSKNRYRNASRGNESMKRARSVETIMRFDLRSGSALTGSVGPPGVVRGDDKVNSMESFNEDVVIVEEGNEKIEDSHLNDKTVVSQPLAAPRERINKPKRLTSFMDETERPPPDVVKTTMRIFESSPGRKIKPPKPTGDVAAKVATYKTIIGNEKNNKKVHVTIPKPIISPKPYMSPEKTRQSPVITTKPQFNFASPGSPKKIISQIEKERSLSPIPKKIGLEIIGKRPASPILLKTEIESPVNSKPSTPVQEVVKSLEKIDLLSSPPTPTSPVIVKQIAEQFLKQETVEAPKIARPSTPEPVKTTLPPLFIDSPVTNLTKQIRNLSLDSPAPPVVINNKDMESDEESEDADNKTISQKSLENISKAGMTMQFNFSSVSSKSHLPGAQPEVNGKKPEISNLKNSESIPVGVIRPLVSNQQQTKNNSTVLTNREIEKNLINRVKTLEQPVAKVVVSNNVKTAEPSAVLPLGNNKSVSVENGKTGAKKTWHQQTNNTMVFNFSDRKEVPDYIENDGIILRSKKEKPKPNDSGFILLGGVQQESSSDWDDDVDSDWAGPPSPCNVSFENDNVIINGRSNLAGTKSRATKLQIHFDDATTSIFEYPSESSLLEEAVMASLNSSSGLSSTPMGNTPLANYTPSKVGINNHFELGITRNAAPEVPKTAASTNHTDAVDEPRQSQITQNGTNNEEPESLQYLKPATDDQTISWSHETKSTDILF